MPSQFFSSPTFLFQVALTWIHSSTCHSVISLFFLKETVKLGFVCPFAGFFGIMHQDSCIILFFHVPSHVWEMSRCLKKLFAVFDQVTPQKMLINIKV